MPCPNLMRAVRWLAAPRNTSGALEWEYSSRKWCSTSHTKSMPRESASSTCSGVLQQAVLRLGVPGAGELVLVEDAELHVILPAWAGGAGGGLTATSYGDVVTAASQWPR